MKKQLSIILALVMALSLLTACGGSKGNESDSDNDEYTLHLDDENGYYFLDGKTSTGEYYGFLASGGAFYGKNGDSTILTYTRDKNDLTFDDYLETFTGIIFDDDSIVVKGQKYTFAEPDGSAVISTGDDDDFDDIDEWYGTFDSSNGRLVLKDSVIGNGVDYSFKMDDGNEMSGTIRLIRSIQGKDDHVEMTRSNGTIIVGAVGTDGVDFSGVYKK